MITTLILTAALTHGQIIHYEHDYPDVAACESGYSIAKHQMKQFGARMIRGDCLAVSTTAVQTQRYLKRSR